MKENYRISIGSMIKMWSANEIRSVIDYKGKKIILLKPISDEEPLDNIICIDDDNNIVWQVENVKKYILTIKKCHTKIYFIMMVY